MGRSSPAAEPGVDGIVLILCDQLNRNLLSYINPAAPPTPNIDRLAARSLRFDRAYVTNPTCMPNRAAIFSGRWPSVNGTRTNGIALDPTNPTVTELLLRGGWSTSAAGKLHFQSMGWPFEPHQIADIDATAPNTFDAAAVDATAVPNPETWDGYENLEAHRAGRIELPHPYYGFEHVDLVVGHGDRPSGNYWQWAAEQGVDLDAVAGRDHGVDPLSSWDEVWGSRVPVAAHHTTYTVDKAIDQLALGSTGSAPFFVCCSFADPHHPFCPPVEYFDRYSPDDVQLPATFAAPHQHLVPHLRHIKDRIGHAGDPTETWAPDEHQMRAIFAAQYGQTAMLDDAIGRLLDAIDTSGKRIGVIFTTDHGDMMGEHGLVLKHWAHYEATTRVPLLVAVPGVSPGDRSDLVSSADIAATICSMGGVAPTRGMQARSLLEAPPRDALMIEEEHLFGFADLPAPINIRTLITDRFRMTRYFGTTSGELYDLDDDPNELVNLYSDPGHASMRSDLEHLMVAELVTLADRGRTPTDTA